MKKLISLVLAVAMICALSTVAFANDLEGSYLFVGTASEIVDGTFTYSINLAEVGADSLTMGTSGATWRFDINYDSEAFELVSTTPVLGYGFSFDKNNSDVATAGFISASIEGASEPYETTFTAAEALASFTFKVKDGAADGEKAFELVDLEIADCDSFNNLTLGENLTAALAPVTLGTPGPTENVATYVTNELALDVAGEIKNFTDVPVYEATTTATSFKLKAVYGEEYNYLKFNGAEEINVSNIKVDGDGEVSFQVAIIGVPAGVTIDKLIVE